MSLATRPAPVLDNWNRPFWDACRERRLLLQRCRGTGRCFHPPAPVSPFTGRPEWEWVEASGRGEVFSFVVFHQNYFPGMRDEMPYPVVMVRLEEGPYLLTNLSGLTAEHVRVGMPVSVRFEDGPEGFVLPQFGPAEAGR